MAEAAKTPTGQQSADDQSMEEILQSIRRIIAEEGDEKAENAPPPPGAGSDVLELTDMVRDDGSVVNLKLKDAVPEPAEAKAAPAAPAPAPKPAAAAPAPAPRPAASGMDVLSNIDKALNRGGPGSMPDAESLISQAAEAKSLDALKALTSAPRPAPVAAAPAAGPVFRSGATVEDLVVEALKPMLKDWLDTQLPSIVERVVTREIKRITSSLE